MIHFNETQDCLEMDDELFSDLLESVRVGGAILRREQNAARTFHVQSVTMTDLTIALPNEVMIKLQELAEYHNVTPEDLVRASVEELIASPEETFQNVVDYVLQKNQKLYQRLAA